jgi:phosphatidylinositol alpha-1,6-mannosyltransferase
MARVLMISKPVAPPWNDSSKNLVRDVASHLERHRAVILSLRDAGVQQALPGGSAVEVREIYPAHPGKLAPPFADQMRVMLELLTGSPPTRRAPVQARSLPACAG